jgi:hypothetical protein
MSDKRELPRTLPSFDDEFDLGHPPGSRALRQRSVAPPLPARAARAGAGNTLIPPPMTMSGPTSPALPPPPTSPKLASLPPPPRLRASAAPAPRFSASDERVVTQQAEQETVDFREILLRAPQPVELSADIPVPTSRHPTYNSVAPVSMSSTELEDVPDRPRRGSRLAYTVLLAGTFLAALFVYWTQPQRHVATPAAPILESPMAAVFKSEMASPAATPPAVLAAQPSPSIVPELAQLKLSADDKQQEHPRLEKLASKEHGAKQSEDNPYAEKSTSSKATPEPAAAEPDPKVQEPAAEERQLPEFSTSAAQQALSAIASSAGSCITEGNPAATIRVAVTFAPTGNVTTALVDGAPFLSGREGGCIARLFHAAKVPAYQGGLVTVRKSFSPR